MYYKIILSIIITPLAVLTAIFIINHTATPMYALIASILFIAELTAIGWMMTSLYKQLINEGWM